MIRLCLVLIGLSMVPTLARSPRSLTEASPSNIQEDAQDQVENNGEADRASRQDPGDSAKRDVASSYTEGMRCIDKVLMEYLTEWDTQYTCHHSYNRRCAKSLTTTYNAAQEEECEENYVKKCLIEYTAYAQNVTVNVCRTPLVKDCDQQGEELCTTEYESECVTEQLEHQVEDDVPECHAVVDEKCEDITSGYTSSQKCSKWPREECVLSKQDRKKYSPQTRCEKIPVTLCGPAGCGLVEGEEVCYERTQTVVGDKPEETCSLDPQTRCRHVTKLVPFLKEVENCFDVPKEVCVREQRNPRKVAKPVIKKWCYPCPDCFRTPPPPPPCEECQASIRRGECTNECYQKYGLGECCLTCPNICKQFAREGQTYKNTTLDCSDFEDKSCYFESPSKCMNEAKKGKCPSECPAKCCDCSVECQEKSLWGECPAQCKQFAGNPDCCAATCPAKCTNKRRKECSGGGVAECDGIPGCCPEKFDVVFGPGVFLDNEEQ